MIFRDDRGRVVKHTNECECKACAGENTNGQETAIISHVNNDWYEYDLLSVFLWRDVWRVNYRVSNLGYHGHSVERSEPYDDWQQWCTVGFKGY